MAFDGGYNHSVAHALDGNLWAWGDNDSGQLGNGTGVGQCIPVLVDPF
jgi:alpha-tubulin suppressor-like RCC1 family protein